MSEALIQYQAHIDRLKENGETLVDYSCPHCASALQTMAAPSGETWDSTCACPHCNEFYFKITTGRKVKALLV
ncbi:hypothetical protein VPZ60_004309 [Salmonella enterica]|nr:hypothetical protein [Salmonella enterica]